MCIDRYPPNTEYGRYQALRFKWMVHGFHAHGKDTQVWHVRCHENLGLPELVSRRLMIFLTDTKTWSSFDSRAWCVNTDIFSIVSKLSTKHERLATPNLFDMQTYTLVQYLAKAAHTGLVFTPEGKWVTLNLVAASTICNKGLWSKYMMSKKSFLLNWILSASRGTRKWACAFWIRCHAPERRVSSCNVTKIGLLL